VTRARAEAALGPDAAPRNVVGATDESDKSGATMLVKWEPPARRSSRELEIVGYQVSIGEEGKPLAPKATVKANATSAPISGVKPGVRYRVQVTALWAPPGSPWYPPGEKSEDPAAVPASVASSPQAGPFQTVGQWFDTSKANVLVVMLLYGIIVVLCFYYARHRDMYVRPIAGLEAVEDAVGRATEMGRSMLYVAGLSSIGDIATIASMLILGHLAKRTAAYDTPILVPCYDPLVMAAEREIVREAYLEAGQPQNFRPDSIFFVTDSQFGYVAAVDGIMIREKPAANFFMGSFAAEALILAETGNATGAIQIAGTDSDTQIPFFITACDYTLMGEELYAAGAYLSRHPTLLAQLKGQDIGKAIITVALVACTLAVTALMLLGHQDWADWIRKLLET
jgi:hypothetical protein